MLSESVARVANEPMTAARFLCSNSSEEHEGEACLAPTNPLVGNSPIPLGDIYTSVGAATSFAPLVRGELSAARLTEGLPLRLDLRATSLRWCVSNL